MTPARSPKKPPRTYSKHGLTQLKAAVKALGNRVIEGRTNPARFVETVDGSLC